MVVLFGVLNNKYIALHTTTPFSDYFDPRLLSDLSTELHVQVISSANDGLRYAFVLESGQLSLPPASTETSEPAAIDPAPLPAHQPDNATLGENQVLQHQRLARFLQITDVLNNNANTQAPPDVLLMDQAEFNQQMADFEAKRELSSTQKSS
jgi:hypothetical protein